MAGAVTPITGQCLCGAVRYTITGPMRPVIACHCKQCQRACGSYFMATNVALNDITVDDSESTLSWFRDPDGDWAQRGFCNRCGSNIFWQRDDAGTISITAGTVDEPHSLRLVGHIFVADKGTYYDIRDDLPQAKQSSGGNVPI